MKNILETIRYSIPWKITTRGIKSFTTYSWNFLRYQNLISILRLYKLENKYQGQRCFILGNGPSLSNTDLSLLKNEFTFGTNRIYILFDQLGFSTTFYVAIDKQLVHQYKNDIKIIPSQKFLLLADREGIKFEKDVIFLRSQDRVNFWTYPAQKIYISGSVTYVAMQLAFFMGFNPVILIGVDHNYSVTSSTKEKAKVIAFNGSMHDHFDPNYFKDGDLWVPPNLEKIELGYRIAKFMFEKNGREILNATIGGKLDVFPKVEYKSLF